MSKKVLISGYYGFGNFGDEAILDVLIKKLKQFQFNIKVFSSNPLKTEKNYKVNCANSFNFLQIKNEIKNCDLLISGGGNLLQDVTSFKSLMYYLYVIRTALSLKKKVIIFAQGIGPVHNKFGRFLLKRTLKRCDLVTVRDEKSLFLLRGWGIKCELVCDPLFDLSLIGTSSENKVGVQLRSFKTLTDNLLNKLAEQIINDFSDKKIEIFSFQDSLDLDVCRKFELMLKTKNSSINTEVIYGKTQKEIIDRISKLDYMIAMRFHANLIALKYGIKTLAICYDEKVEKLAQDAQIPFLSMLANEDYDFIFQTLKNSDKRRLLLFSNTKHFDWKSFEDVFRDVIYED